MYGVGWRGTNLLVPQVKSSARAADSGLVPSIVEL